MYDLHEKSPILVYPDPIINTNMLSGAMFLYFDRPIEISLPPLVITEGSYHMLKVIEEKKPDWASTFFRMFYTWQLQMKCCREVFEMLNPLKGEHLKYIWTSYPANKVAMEKSKELIDSSRLSNNALKKMINPINASGELIRHIMLESFLEADKDIYKLFDDCNVLFKEESMDELLVKSYILRLHALNSFPQTSSIVLTNYPIWNSLLNNEFSSSRSEEKLISEGIDRDVIAWEIFKNIISPKLDPMDKDKVKFITKLLKSNKAQIEMLKLKCFSLADKLKQNKNLGELPTKAIELIKSDIQKEITELLELDRKAYSDYLTFVFSDEKTWLGLAAFIGGIGSGSSTITTSGAIATLSLVGSKAVQSSKNRREKIHQSDFGLVYSISKKYS